MGYEIYNGIDFASLCDGRDISFYEDSQFNIVKPTDLYWNGSAWVEFCPPEATLYYGLALGNPSGTVNPTLTDSNVDEIGVPPDDYVWPDGSNVSLRLWFATADTLIWDGSHGAGTGPPLPVNVNLFIDFGGSGSVPLGSVTWNIYDRYQISGITVQSWLGGKNIASRLNAGINQASFTFNVNLPAIDDYFDIKMIITSGTNGRILVSVPTRFDVPTKDWGWEVNLIDRAEGRWRVKRQF